MSHKKLVLFQIIIETLIPLLGFFYWNWNASFILLFYLVDWLLFAVLTQLKVRKCQFYFQQSSQEKNQLLTKRILGFLGIPLTVILVFFTLKNIHPNYDWLEQTWNFLTFEDMGLPNAALLLPLLVLNGVLDFKQKFIKYELFKRIPPLFFVRYFYLESLIAFAVFAVVYVVSFFYQIQDEVLLFGTVIGIFSFRISTNANRI
ncbi:MAG TPA: hypothetical protein PLI97_05595 [Fluviicola sp.]|nr:hypothetical protein [Fluviicola sp.]